MSLTKPDEDLTRYCMECHEKLGPGREDRKFCDNNCRTSYNNKKRKERLSEATLQETEPIAEELSVPDYIHKIQDILIQNRRILAGICEEQPVKMRMRDLIGRGFNTKFFTSQADPTQSGNVYRFCFEYGYMEKEGGEVVIVQRPREVII